MIKNVHFHNITYVSLVTVNTGPTVRSEILRLAANVFNFSVNPTFCQFSWINRADCAEHFYDKK